MPKVKLYIPEPLQGVPLATWFAPLPAGLLFTDNLPPNFFTTDVEWTKNADNADAIVLQNSFRSVDASIESHIKKYADLGREKAIPVFIFSLGDFTDTLRFDARVFALRFSLYHGTAGAHDIAMPTTAEIPPAKLLTIRAKEPVPTVGFCGKGAFPSWRAWAGYFIKETLLTLQSLGNPMLKAKKIGVYWRRAMMRACRGSGLVRSNFIIRKSFSSIRKTIELDPAVAREQFLQNIIESDFVLAPKGDGNYSNRFLETLSLGRIPVLVDTDVVLPLEDVIEYSKIVVKVPMRDVRNTPRYIADFYHALSDDEWQARQTLARDTFNRYLRQDAYFGHFFRVVAPTLRAKLPQI